LHTDPSFTRDYATFFLKIHEPQHKRWIRNILQVIEIDKQAYQQSANRG